MWQCLNCAEQLEDAFDTCWKCGTDINGVRDPDFCVSEPATNEDQSRTAAVDERQLPALQLPSLTYVCIPPFLWLSTASLIRDECAGPTQRGPIHLSAIEIVFLAIGVALVYLPVGFELFRGCYTRLVRKQRGAGGLSDFVWLLSMFRLPQSLHGRYRWFAVVYYGSIVAYVVAPPIAIVRRIFEMGSV
jgi:hypothetical protein